MAGRSARPTQTILTREPGDRRDRPTQPLSRVKEEVMLSRPRFVAVAFLSVISVSALASELTVRVVDPSSAAVSGAQVEVFSGNSSRPLAVDVTSAQGVAHFNHLPDSV